MLRGQASKPRYGPWEADHVAEEKRGEKKRKDLAKLISEEAESLRAIYKPEKEEEK